MSKSPLLVIAAFVVATAAVAKTTGESTYDPAKHRAANEQAFAAFNHRFGDRWLVAWNPITGTPHSISGYFLDLPSPLTKETVEAETRKVLLPLQEMLQIDPSQLVLSSADFDAPSNGKGGIWYVAYRQVYGAAHVDGGSVRLIVRGTRVTTLASDFYPRIGVTPDPSITADAAFAAVAAVDDGKPAAPTSVELIVHTVVIGGVLHYHLAWAIVLPPRPRGAQPAPVPGGQQQAPTRAADFVQWRYVVDAHGGRILDRINLIVNEDINGRVTGTVVPLFATDTPVEMPIHALIVRGRQGSASFEALTGPGGNYRLTGLLPGAVTLESFLEGPHIRIFNEETPDPDTTHTASLTAPATHDWNWNADDPSPSDVETNAFFHVNEIRDSFLRGDPFDVAPTPDPMPVRLRIHDYCNASAGPEGLQFGSSPCGDFARCPDILYHEYTHRIVAQVYSSAGAGAIDPAFFGAMNEAWADYFATTRTDSPVLGEACVIARNIDLPDRRFPVDLTGEPHFDGTIFAGALWDVRRDLGRSYVDGLAMRAMKHTPANFSEYLGAVLEEDDDPAFSTDPLADGVPTNGTPNIETICHEYSDIHGIFHPYCLGHTLEPIAVITTPDPVRRNVLPPGATVVAVDGSALGTPSDPLASFVLDYARYTDPGTFISAGVTLTSGGLSPVSDGELGRIDLTTLANGRYTIRLTVRSAAGRTAVATTSFFLDRDLMPGWPQATADIYFGSAPAVDDLDPSTPGLEIIATGGSGTYAWHADGTAVAGWPVFLPSLFSPAVGDLDNDGRLEVAVARTTLVDVLRADGSILFERPVSGEIRGNPVLADLDGDGRLELLVIGSGNDSAPMSTIYAWHDDGTAVPGWPVTVPEPMPTAVGAGDVDHDGLPEIAAGSTAGHLYLWNSHGTLLPGWPVSGAGAPPLVGTPSFADVDGDGTLEVFVSSGVEADEHIRARTQVYAWHRDGTPVAGWPREVTQFFRGPGGPLFADLDADGTPEVLGMPNDDRVHAWRANGTLLPGWPSPPIASLGFDPNVGSPAVGDIDGDGDLEILSDVDQTGAVREMEYIARHHDGSVVSGWPKVIPLGFLDASPVLADVDLDGHVDVVVGSAGISVWTLPGAFSGATNEWPTNRHDNRRTGAYDTRPEIALLFDVSGSMHFEPNGDPPADPSREKIALARQAANAFLDLLSDFAPLRARLGIAAFPAPSTPFACEGETLYDMKPVNDTNIGTARATIAALAPIGNTPLLKGMDHARAMLEPGSRGAIVLLSDGYHNCPAPASVGDPEVTALITNLRRQGAHVFSIGFGSPADIDHPLLETLASSTTPPGSHTSQFYDVTTPSFDPATWDPATALQATYKSVLVDALGLDGIFDPLGSIAAGRRVSYDIDIHRDDHTVSFFLSWRTPRTDRLLMTIRASDGSTVPLSGAGIRLHRGETYTILTVGHEFLALPGKVGSHRWSFEISTAKFAPNEVEPYQASVIADSALRMRIGLDPIVSFAGQPILLTADLRDRDLHLTRAKAEAIITAPLAKAPVTLTLFDNGTHGDPTPNDGIYSAIYKDTTAAGVYSFRFHAEGKTDDGQNFTRERLAQRFLRLPSPSDNPP